MSSSDNNLPTNESQPSTGHTGEMELAPGQTIGEYEVVGKIGRGGFGSVFKAIHPLIGKVVAIKILHPEYSSQPQMVSRFTAEARAVNQIQHRNIIDIFAFGTINDKFHYYVMEYLDGEALEDYIERNKRLSAADAIAILRPIARALHAAHCDGITHRDLKADNIFLSRDRDGVVEPKLLDFGIAKLLNDGEIGHRTREGVPIGTPAYMSPEQCMGQNVDHRTDIYAFGILLYRMLTGVLPFSGTSYLQVLFQHTNDPVPPLRQHVPELPEPIEASVLAMLAKKPEERPQTMEETLDMLVRSARAAGVEIPSESGRITLPGELLQGNTPRPRTSSGGGSGAQLKSNRSPGSSSSLSTDETGVPVYEAATMHSTGERSPQSGPFSNSAATLMAGDDSPDGVAAPASASASAKSTPLGHTDIPIAETVAASSAMSTPSAAAASIVQTSEHKAATPRRLGVWLGLSAAAVAIVAAVVFIPRGSTPQPGNSGESTVAAAGDPTAQQATDSADPRAAGTAAQTQPGDQTPSNATDNSAANSAGDNSTANSADDNSATPGAPAAPALVNINISGPPPGTKVYGPTGLMGVAPGVIQTLQSEQALILTFEADDYQVTTATVVPSEHVEVEVELERKASKRRPSSRKNAGNRRKDTDKSDPAPRDPPKPRDDRNALSDPFADKP